ncbi:MAG: hypothetical protein HN985_11905, partial [Planctomycetaceae bacterium]|nr:hypothetical protein [Planctomycetaceae bacterium]
MRNTHQRTSLLAITFLLILPWPNTVRAEDQPDLLELPAKDWRMYGGHLKRNFANPTVNKLPDSWDISDGTNVAFSIQLGSRAYGGPVMSGGR